MRAKVFTVLFIALFAAACGDKSVNTSKQYYGNNQNNNESDNIDLDTSVNPDNIEIEGIYKIAYIKFDSDPSIETTTDSIISTVMRHVEGSTNGKPWFVQAALKDSRLNLNSDGTFRLTYSFYNASNQDVEIGIFTKGRQQGEYEISGNTVSFFLYEETIDAFSDAADSTYTASVDKYGDIILSVNSPSKEGLYFTEIKCTK